MAPVKPVDAECRPTGASTPVTPVFEDLVPIAVVIGAGCAPCAERMVRRAVRRGSPESSIARTLGSIRQLGSAECFAAAVGPEVVARMAAALQAGDAALRQAERPSDDCACRG